MVRNQNHSPPGVCSQIPGKQKDITMETCSLCQEQAKKTHRGKPHHALIKVSEARIFTGTKPRGYEEQDYKCLDCESKFTQSTGKNDLAWTLWQG